MLWIGGKEPNITGELLSGFPLLNYCARCWTSHICALDGHFDDDLLQNLTLSFMDVDAYAWKIWNSTGLPQHEGSTEDLVLYLLRHLVTGRGRIKEESWLNFHPLTWASIFSMTSIYNSFSPECVRSMTLICPSVIQCFMSTHFMQLLGMEACKLSRLW